MPSGRTAKADKYQIVSVQLNLLIRSGIQAGKMSACLAMPLPMMEAPRTGSAPSKDADTELVRRAAAGETRAFEALYRRHAGRVHGAVWRLSGMNEARAEELTQEAFVRAWQKLGSFRFESAFSTWLHRLAVNVALMDLRARDPEDAVDTDVLEAASDPVVPFCAGERADLEQAVAKLPPRARAVLVLHDVEGWKHEEIGRELGMAVGSSKAQLHRARGLLRTMLGEAS
jgi:RNA polymerase sigma-70 factor (ECF subfamily)